MSDTIEELQAEVARLEKDLVGESKAMLAAVQSENALRARLEAVRGALDSQQSFPGRILRAQRILDKALTDTGGTETRIPVVCMDPQGEGGIGEFEPCGKCPACLADTGGTERDEAMEKQPHDPDKPHCGCQACITFMLMTGGTHPNRQDTGGTEAEARGMAMLLKHLETVWADHRTTGMMRKFIEAHRAGGS